MVMYLYLFLLVFNDMVIVVFRGYLFPALRHRADEPHAVTPQMPLLL